MVNDLINQLQQLQNLRALLGDETYTHNVSKLRVQHGADAIDAMLASIESFATVRTHTQPIAGQAQVGVAVAGNVHGDVLAPLFSAGATGNYIASVLNLYQQAPAAPQADYAAALQRYLTHLYSQYATLDLRGIDDRPMDMPLSEIYVSLNLHEPPPDELRGRGALRGFFEMARSFVMGDDALPSVRIRPEPVDWTVALRHPRLVVIGAPGGGKTTLLHYTAVRLCEVLAHDDYPQLSEMGMVDLNGFAAAPPVPLLLPLRELGSYLSITDPREASGANPRLLLDCLANFYNRVDLDLPPDFFRRLCEAGRAILLLDGLDEVVSSEDRAFVSAVVRNFAQRYTTCRYVVTARVAAYLGDAQIGAGFQICTVDDLNDDQQQRFVNNWSRSLHRLLYKLRGNELERAAARYSSGLWQALNQNDRVRALATSPLLLTVVAVIFHNNYVLPEDRAALYEECVEVLLRGGRGKADRAAQQRAQFGGQPYLTMGLNPKRELLAAVAYTMHQRGVEGVFVSRAELIQLVSDHLHHRSDAVAAAQAFVDELPVHIGLLDEREPDRFSFSHLSFQEFLAARYIATASETRWNELLEHYQESWWREVILLCAGHLSQERCWKFLERLTGMGSTPEERAAALELAADVLVELERFKGQGPLNARVAAEAVAILEAPPQTASARVRVQCGHALARVGDPRPGVCTLPPIMVRIEGGAFVIGNTQAEYQAIIDAEKQDRRAKEAESWYQDTINEAPMIVHSFEVARFPVTNAQFKLFMDHDGYSSSRPWWDDAARIWLQRDDQTVVRLAPWQRRLLKDRPEYWDSERYGIANPNYPVVGISWYEASAFCRWLTSELNDGYIYQLPSEAEWEYAARGSERRPYPWGNAEPDGERANVNELYRGTTVVGCFLAGATPEGVLDLIGNVREWTRSSYRSYPYNPYDGRELIDDPASARFAFRGGSWFYPQILLRASYRSRIVPSNHADDVGFRLVRHPKV